MGVLLFSLVINVIVCVFCVKLGEEKGYSVALWPGWPAFSAAFWH